MLDKRGSLSEKLIYHYNLLRWLALFLAVAGSGLLLFQHFGIRVLGFAFVLSTPFVLIADHWIRSTVSEETDNTPADISAMKEIDLHELATIKSKIEELDLQMKQLQATAANLPEGVRVAAIHHFAELKRVTPPGARRRVVLDTVDETTDIILSQSQGGEIEAEARRARTIEPATSVE